MAGVDRAGWVRLRCLVQEIRPGDEVFTPSWRWETVTAVAAGDGYPRRIWITTDATGVEHPWSWVTGHRLPTRRPPAQLPTAVAA